MELCRAVFPPPSSRSPMIFRRCWPHLSSPTKSIYPSACGPTDRSRSARPNVNGRAVSLFEATKSPHLCLWLDAPERAHSNGIRGLFNTGFFKSDYLYHWINNPGSAREMTEIFGFSNVIPQGYGINPDLFHPDPAAKKEFDIVLLRRRRRWNQADQGNA